MTDNLSLFNPATAEKPKASLYLVATPIGNLRDITLRALDILFSADIIACEDTRVTAKLKNAYGIKAKLISYHEHNEEKATQKLLKELSHDNKIIALVSDAGTPLMSDPGYRIAKACIDKNIPVFSIPGACASITAITLSGLPVNRFLFNGFLPSKTKARREELSILAEIPSTLVFYESNHRLLAVLNDMLDILGNRDAVVAREMTKKFEEISRSSLKELIDFYSKKDKIKGELTIVVAPTEKKLQKLTEKEIDEILISHLKSGDNIKEISKEIASKTGLKKRDLYNRMQKLKEQLLD